MVFEIKSTRNDNHRTAGESLLFAPNELKQYDQSIRKSKIAKIFIIITLLIIALFVGSYFLRSKVAPNDKSIKSVSSPLSRPEETQSQMAGTSPDAIAAAQAAAKAAEERANLLNQKAKSAQSDALQQAQRANQNIEALAQEQQAVNDSASSQLQQQSHTIQSSAQQQAAQLATCKTNKDQATAPISQKIQSATTSYNNAYNAWKASPYSTDPSSDYQRLMVIMNNYSQQINSLQAQLSATWAQYSC